MQLNVGGYVSVGKDINPLVFPKALNTNMAQITACMY